MVLQDDGSILSFSAANLQPSWTSEEYLRRELSNGTLFKDVMLTGDLEGYVHAINPLTGKTVGRKKRFRQRRDLIFLKLSRSSRLL